MPEHQALENTRSAIGVLRSRVYAGRLPRSSRTWGGANVVIASSPQSSHYREIVTNSALELSWLFEQLVAIFASLIDSCSKSELYGRFELAANCALKVDPDASGYRLCSVVLDEAERILEEMALGQFTVLPVAIGVTIAHDA